MDNEDRGGEGGGEVRGGRGGGGEGKGGGGDLDNPPTRLSNTDSGPNEHDLTHVTH